MPAISNLPLVRTLGAAPLHADPHVALDVVLAQVTQDGDLVPAFQFEAWVRNVAHVVTDIAGGCQMFRGEAFWCTPTQANCNPEPIVSIRAQVPRQALTGSGVVRLRQALAQYKQECAQNAVAVSLDGEWFLL